MCITVRHLYRLLLVTAAVLVGGCTFGPREIHHSRLKYNTAIQQTFQEEMLLNLVRLKYREIPEFVTIGGIAAQYSFEGSASTGLTVPEAGRDVLGINGGVARSEKPTISYNPARGEDFQKGLLAPIGIESLQLLGRTGWSWERILRTTVQCMNEVDNATSAGGPTPQQKPQFEEFRYLAHMLRQLQVRQMVELTDAEHDGPEKLVPVARDRLDGDFVIAALKEGYSFKETPRGLSLYKEHTYKALVFRPDAKATREMQEVARLLGLAVDYDSALPEVYELATSKKGQIQPAFAHLNQSVAAYPPAQYPHAQTSWAQQNGVQTLPPPTELQQGWQGRKDIVVSTRSLLEVMFYLSQGISIPEEHLAQGLVTITVDEQGRPFDWTEMTGDLLRVCCSKKRPQMAAVSIPYNGYWYYIDDRDLNSQSTFTLLVELFGIEVRAGGGGGFLYTLNVGG